MTPLQGQSASAAESPEISIPETASPLLSETEGRQRGLPRSCELRDRVQVIFVTFLGKSLTTAWNSSRVLGSRNGFVTFVQIWFFSTRFGRDNTDVSRVP